jgi:hypothetical protein
MKIYALHDAHGAILAAVDLDAEAKHPKKLGSLRPIVGHGHHAGEFEVPHSHAHLDLKGVSEAMRVDVGAKKLVPRAR